MSADPNDPGWTTGANGTRWHQSGDEGNGWPDQPSRRDSRGRVTTGSGGVGWPVQPSSLIKPEPEPVLTDPEALADAVIKRRGH